MQLERTLRWILVTIAGLGLAKVAQVLVDKHGLSAMSRAHREILHLAQPLGRIVEDLPLETIDHYLIRDAQRVIEAIEALVRIHTAQEEDIDDAVVASNRRHPSPNPPAQARPPRSRKSSEALAIEYVKSHSRKVADIMTAEIIAAAPDTPLREAATLLEKHHIKRVPIVAEGKLVGIVTRANLIQALARVPKPDKQGAPSDAECAQVMAQFRTEPWSKHSSLNATVHGGTVELWGYVGSDAEKEAARVATELVPGVRAIENNVIVRPVVRSLFLS